MEIKFDITIYYRAKALFIVREWIKRGHIINIYSGRILLRTHASFICLSVLPMLLQQYIVKIQLCMPGIAHLFKILQYTTEQMCDLVFFSAIYILFGKHYVGIHHMRKISFYIIAIL